MTKFGEPVCYKIKNLIPEFLAVQIIDNLKFTDIELNEPDVLRCRIHELIGITTKPPESADALEHILHLIVLRYILQINTVLCHVPAILFQQIIQDLNTGVERSWTLLQNQPFLTDNRHLFRLRYIFPENIPAKNITLHPLCKSTYKLFRFLITVYFPFLILRVIESHGKTQHQ